MVDYLISYGRAAAEYRRDTINSHHERAERVRRDFDGSAKVKIAILVSRQRPLSAGRFLHFSLS